MLFSAAGEDLCAQDASIYSLHTRTLFHLASPQAACFGEDGRGYIVEALGGRVRVVNDQGESLRSWGSIGGSNAHLLRPSGICTDQDSLYVADTENHRIQVFTTTGAYIRSIGSPGRNRGQLRSPTALAVSDAKLYVIDSGNHRLQVFNLQGQPLASWPNPKSNEQLLNPQGLAVGDNGTLYIADTGNHRIVELNSTLEFVRAWGERGSEVGLFSSPQGLLFLHGHLYVADSENHRIQIFDNTGNSIQSWGHPGKQRHEAKGRLHYPTALAYNTKTKELMICEAFENRVQWFAKSEDPVGSAEDLDIANNLAERCATRGNILAILNPELVEVHLYDLRSSIPTLMQKFGEYGTDSDQLLAPTDLCLARGRRVFVLDAGARMIKVFEYGQQLGARMFKTQALKTQRSSRFLFSIDLAILFAEHPTASDFSPEVFERDPSGHLYLLDRQKSLIAILSPDFKLKNIVGGIGSRRGQFLYPSDIIHHNDFLYVVDSGNRRIQVLRTSGAYFYQWGSRKNERRPLSFPYSISSDGEGHIFVSDLGSDRVVAYDERGNYRGSWGQPNANEKPSERLAVGYFYKPKGISCTDRKQLIVIDYGHQRYQFTDLKSLLTHDRHSEAQFEIFGIENSLEPKPMKDQ